MASPIVIKRSSVAGKAPLATDLQAGELALNTADAKLFTKNSSGVIVQLAPSAGGGGSTTNALTVNNSGTGAASGTTFNGSTAVTVSYNSIGAAPLASPTFTGKVTTPQSTTAGAGFNLPSSVAPTSPNFGDLWATTGGLFFQLNGVTQPVITGANVGGTGHSIAWMDQVNTWTGQQTFANNSGVNGNFYIGSNNFSSSPGSGMLSGAIAQSGVDTPGGPITFQGGPGTGAGAPGTISFQVATPLVSGSGQQNPSNNKILTLNYSVISTTVRFAFAASTTAGASITIPPGTAPTTPNNGDMWTTNYSPFIYLNGGAKQIVTTADVFSTNTAGVVPASPGGSTLFLRCDSSWQPADQSLDTITRFESGGVVTVAIQDAIQLVQRVQGTLTSDLTLIYGDANGPYEARVYTIKNDTVGSFNLYVKASSNASANAVLVPQGAAVPVYFNQYKTTVVGPPSAAGSTIAVTAQGATYTEAATSGEVVRRITATGITVNLPTAAGNTAKMTFKLMVPGTAIIDGFGSETIDGGLTATLNSQYAAITIVSDGANWIII